MTRASAKPFLTLALLLLAAGVVYSLLWPDAPAVYPDSRSYMRIARDLQDGRIDQLHERTFGYPLLLLLTGSHTEPQRVVFHLQLGFHFGSVLLLSWVLHQLGVRRGLILPLVVLSLFPTAVRPSAWLLTESFAEFLLSLGVAGLTLWLRGGRWRWLILAAVSLAYCALAHPTFKLLAIGIAVCFFALPIFFSSLTGLQRRFVHAAWVLLIAAIALIGSVTFYNYRTFGHADLSTALAYALPNKTIAVLEQLPDEYAEIREILIRHRDAMLVRRGGHHDGDSYFYPALPELKKATGLDDLELSRLLVHVTVVLIRIAPVDYLNEVARSVAAFWMPCYDDDVIGWTLLVYTAIHFAAVSLFCLPTLLLGALVAVPWKSRQRWIGATTENDRLRYLSLALALAVIGYTMLVASAAGFPGCRYRLPVELLTWFAGILALDTWIRLIDRR